MDIDHVKTSGDLLLEAHFHPHTRSAEHALGTIIWIHGAFEHQGRYEHVIHDFQERGFQSISFDLRGQGRSRGTRMFIETEADYLDDVSAVVNHYRDKMAGPLILFGHSMGGLVAIRFHQERRAELPHHASTITSAPFLGVAAPVPGWKKSLSKIVVGI